MGRNITTGDRTPQDVGVPQAWVWSRYKGELPESGNQHEVAGDVAPMLYEEKGLHPVETALALLISVAIILLLVWLFTPASPSSPSAGSLSNEQSLKAPPAKQGR